MTYCDYRKLMEELFELTTITDPTDRKFRKFTSQKLINYVRAVDKKYPHYAERHQKEVITHLLEWMKINEI